MAYFSYNQIRTYAECPYQFYLLRVKKLTPKSPPNRAMLGNLLAALTERMYVDGWWRQPELLGRLTKELDPTLRGVEEGEGTRWAPGEREEVLKLALETLPKLVATMRREKLVAPIVRAEFDVEVPIGKDTLIGRADYVFEQGLGGPLTVVDGKAGGTVGRFVKVNQLRLYVLGVALRYKRMPVRAGFWWFRHDLVKWSKVTPASLEKFKAEMAALIARLRANDWTPKPTGYCRTCGVRYACEIGSARFLTREVGNDDVTVGRNDGLFSL